MVLLLVGGGWGCGRRRGRLADVDEIEFEAVGSRQRTLMSAWRWSHGLL